MFDSLSVKAIACAARWGSYKLHDTFLNMLRLSEFEKINQDCSTQLLQKEKSNF